MAKRTVLLGMPLSAYQRTFPQPEQQRLFELYHVLAPATKPTTDDLIGLARGHDLSAVLTVWGAPEFPRAFWEAHPECGFFGHLAGSVKHFFPGDTVDCLLARDVIVVSGQYGLGINVAEATIGLMIALARRFGTHWNSCRFEGRWSREDLPTEPRTLLGATVGLVAASAIGRMVVDLLQPFRCRILCYDPYLSEYDAGRLGVVKVDLDTLLTESDIISLHHPQTAETDRMIGAREFSLLKDGAVFINTARPRAIDPDALLAAARENRFQIALDVTEPEPLPADHPLRSCENVWITPHRAGTGFYGSQQVGWIVMEALDQYLQGRPVTARYPLERLALMA